MYNKGPGGLGGVLVDQMSYRPASQVGNPASLDKVFFFTDYYSLGYMQ